MNQETREPTIPGTGSEHKKLGLALTGGGFRAAFFHIGVLAQMARLGLLHQVEVLSTVSGGSIIGALYYAHVKRLLEEKPDEEITPEDYVKIVGRMEMDFFETVQQNLRMLSYADPWKNLLMYKPNYSRSDRMGELYDEYLYRPVLAPESTEPVRMRDLKIHPKLSDGRNDTAFHPGRGNAERTAKVPILLINATTLNTGHIWRFETHTMGLVHRETELELDIDKSLRLLRPPSYEDMHPRHQNMELGLAVAASACVPGIFRPLALSEMYRDKIRLQLVDGGVNDAMGIEGLTEKGCNIIVLSDGSSQMRDEHSPDTEIQSSLERTNDILMDRIAKEQISRIMRDRRREVAFLHLRKGLEVDTVVWDQANECPPKKHVVEPLTPAASEDFGVAPKAQELLGRIRTDFDSFTEVEAYSLMLDGYMISDTPLHHIAGVADLMPSAAPFGTETWQFMRIKPWLTHPTYDYLKQLNIAGHSEFKLFKLNWPLTILTAILLGIALWIIGSWSWMNTLVTFTVKIGTILISIAFVILVLFLPWARKPYTILHFLGAPIRRFGPYFLESLLPAVGSLLVRSYLRTANRVFLEQGKIGRLLRTRDVTRVQKSLQET